ncbi:MAG: hypothetical protein AAGI44_10615 [Pseudomonadota bacterium]
MASSLCIAIALVWQGFSLFSQDLAFTAIEAEVSFWGQGEYVPVEGTREQVGETLATLLNSEPEHPGYLTLATSYYAWRAYWAETKQQELDYNARSERAARAAWLSRPAHPNNAKLMND